MKNISILLNRSPILSISYKLIRNFSIKSKIDFSKVPKLDEEELEEKLVAGHGPGGSKVNRSLNACFLKHKTTGLYVKVHQVREAHKNRQIARELLTLKLDELINGENSVNAQKLRLINEKGKKQDTQAAKRRELRLKHKENNKNLEEEKINLE